MLAGPLAAILALAACATPHTSVVPLVAHSDNRIDIRNLHVRESDDGLILFGLGRARGIRSDAFGSILHVTAYRRDGGAPCTKDLPFRVSTRRNAGLTSFRVMLPGLSGHDVARIEVEYRNAARDRQ